MRGRSLSISHRISRRRRTGRGGSSRFDDHRVRAVVGDHRVSVGEAGAHVIRLESDYSSELDRELRRIYVAGEVARARQEFVRQARRDGWRKEGRRLAQEPQQFGRVRGAGLGPVRNARRASALRSANRIGRVAAELATVRAARVTLGPSAAKAIVRLRRVSRTVQRATAALDRLPSRRKLELEVAKKAAALGVSLIHLTLAPSVLNVARAALNTAGLVREVARGDYER